MKNAVRLLSGLGSFCVGIKVSSAAVRARFSKPPLRFKAIEKITGKDNGPAGALLKKQECYLSLILNHALSEKNKLALITNKLKIARHRSPSVSLTSSANNLQKRLLKRQDNKKQCPLSVKYSLFQIISALQKPRWAETATFKTKNLIPLVVALVPLALIEAAKASDAIKVEALLCNPCINVNTQDAKGETALHHAIRHKHSAVVKLLLSRGADVNIQDKCGCSPFMLAAETENQEALVQLLEHSEKYNNGLIELSILAAEFNQLDMVTLLLNYGADLNAQDNNGETALMLAAKFNHADMVTLLLNCGADLNAQDNAGQTALMLAAKFNHADMVTLLLNYGADLNAQDNNGCTVLILATLLDHKNTVELLLKHFSKSHLQVSDIQTALSLAIVLEHTDEVDLLSNHSAIKNKNGPTAGAGAIMSNHFLEIAEKLTHIISTTFSFNLTTDELFQGFTEKILLLNIIFSVLAIRIVNQFINK